MTAASIADVRAVGARRHVARASCRAAFVAVAVIIIAIVVIWYVAAMLLNAPFQRELDARAEIEPTFAEFVESTWSQERPVLPAPHQVGGGALQDDRSIRAPELQAEPRLSRLGDALLDAARLRPRHAPRHRARRSRSSTCRSLDKSLMPWVVASQTIPILAIAPMVIVVLASVGLTGLLPKAIISTYLSFFPVTVGMVKGLRSPDPINLDLMRTYSATHGADVPEAALAVVGAVPVRLDAGGDRREPGRRHRRRTADRRGGRPRRAAPHRLLLRPDRADLVGAGRRRGAGRRAGRAGRPGERIVLRRMGMAAR